MTDLNDVVRQRVLDELGGAEEQSVSIEPTAPPSAPPQPKEENNWLWILIALVFMSSVTTFGMILYSKANSTKVVPEQQMVEKDRPATPLPPAPGMTPEEVQSTVRPMLDEQSKKLDELKRRVEVISHRQWLLGVAHNENVCVSENNLGPYVPAIRGRYLTIDEDWKLSRVPEFLKMSEEDRARLLDAVRKK
jgi:hypothetical protein